MSETKIIQEVVRCVQANEDTRVVIDNAFSVLVPKGMMFSTDQDEIGKDKLLVIFSSIPSSVNLDDDSFDMQYGNAQIRVRFNAGLREFGGTLDFSDLETRKTLEENFVNSLLNLTDLLTNLVGGKFEEAPFVIKSDEKAIVVANAHGLLGYAQFFFALPFGYYTGMYHVGKGADPEEVMESATSAVYKETAKRLLSTIEVFRDDSANTNQSVSTIRLRARETLADKILINAFSEEESVAPNSPEAVTCDIDELEQCGEIEVSGTQYEGRSERIEHVKVGDELKLVREPDNAYDKNAIDLQNALGSLGHLPAHIVGKLSPLMDLGLVNCTAIVSDVLPLSKRSSRAKKAILKVYLKYTRVQKVEERNP